MICCAEYEDLGCLNSCEPLYFGVSTMDGDYELLLEYNDTITSYSITIEANEPLIFDVNINENYAYTGKLIAPDDSFQCYKFKSKIYVS